MSKNSTKRQKASGMLKLFWQNLRAPEWLCIVIGVIFIVAQVWLDLRLPDFMSDITKQIAMPDGSMKEIWAAGGRMLLCAGGSMLASVAVAISASRMSSNFGANLREKLYLRVQSFSMEEINRFSTASLITRSTNDITQIQMFIVMGLQVIVKAPITAVWAISKIWNKGVEWTTATAITVVLLLLAVILLLKLVRPKFKIMQKLTDNLNRVTRENLNGLSVVRAYNAEGFQEEKFEEANDDLTRTSLFTIRAMSCMMPFIGVLLNALSVAIYAIGAVMINNIKVNIPTDFTDMVAVMGAVESVKERAVVFSDMVVFTSYAMQVVMAFMMLVMIFILMPRASVAAERIGEVLDTKPTISDGDQVEGIAGKEGEIEFRDVSFRYPDAAEDMLEHLSFTAKKGETVAIIGSTGCGKTSAINLIPRFYDATQGEVLVAGRNVKEYTQKALHNKIGYVSQKAFMFKGTIASNLKFGDNGKGEITDEQIENALDTACATSFVGKKEDGINSEVTQGGNNFSGGQKQRLSIARAIARDAEILIFDDSFSALDYKTDRAVRNLLAERCKDTTKIIVAQRIGTILNADKILVMDEGKIVGQGTHKQLMESCEVYQQIALSQLTEEELA